MILSEMKAYLAERKRVPMADIANHFGIAPDAARGMLEIWIRKGRVRRLDSTGGCTGCARCESAHIEIYEWAG